MAQPSYSICSAEAIPVIAPSGTNLFDQWFLFTSGGLIGTNPGVARPRRGGVTVNTDSTLFAGVPVRGGGANWSYAYIPSRPIRAWAGTREPRFQVDVNSLSARTGAVGTVYQAGINIYIHGKTTSGIDVTLSHGMQTWDSRPNYADPEYIGNDTYTDFVSARALPSSKYITLLSGRMHVGPPSDRSERYAFCIPWKKMLAMIADLEAKGSPALSRNPEDWVISSIAFGGEMTPPQTDGGFIADVSNLRLDLIEREAPLPRTKKPSSEDRQPKETP
jgi:hypothetical protein